MQSSLSAIQSATFPIRSLSIFKAKALCWLRHFNTFCYLDHNEYPGDLQQRFECLIGAGLDGQLLLSESANAFGQLKQFRDEQPGWLFGFFSYDLKNDTEALHSSNPDRMVFPQLHFFSPLHVLQIGKTEVTIQSKTISPSSIFSAIESIQLPEKKPTPLFVELRSQMSRAQYLRKVEAIKEHIIAGDIYELNLCQEFYATNCSLDPYLLFGDLNEQSKAPFSAMYKLRDQYLLSASPERFLQKTGRQLLSQPIKGTIGRSLDEGEDAALRDQLSKSTKDLAENVMIVDLVRNDFAKSCMPGSVRVEELFGIYSFRQVHHMISTISGTLRADIHFIDAIKNAFPMGSMTGAPKVMSMKLIEQYEKSRRGVYSGAVGYISPEDDFDFNVVIRSILYDVAAKLLSFQVGGAIVYDSVPEQEYQECLLKAKTMLRILQTEIRSTPEIAC